MSWVICGGLPLEKKKPLVGVSGPRSENLRDETDWLGFPGPQLRRLISD